ncbi:MAG: (Fe-S)-binding protein, partial [Candidatus Aminicenantes bacterium]
MALSGLEIFKLLPKTNCGDCGVPTCMAFAMKLAQKKAELTECPHASEEAKAALGAASEPPIRLVKIGGSNALEIGNETVMFRHDKTFFHQTGIAVELRTSEGHSHLREKIEDIENYKVERVGEELFVDLFFVNHDDQNGDNFLDTIQAVKQNSSKGIILFCPDVELLKNGLEICRDDRPSVFLKKEASDQEFELAKAYNASLILTAQSFESLAAQAEKARESGVSDLILNLESEEAGCLVEKNTVLRRSALKKSFKPFGYPLFFYIRADNPYEALADASVMLCKYGSVIVL